MIPPASTVDTLRQVLIDYDAAADRSQQRALGPSELGTPCRRRIAMRLVGIPRRATRKVPWAPLQGTAVHTRMEDVLAFDNARRATPRWLVEQRLRIDDEISGRGDAYDYLTATSVDWKYVGKTTLDKAKRTTVPLADLVRPEYRVQGHVYGLGHEQAGRPVRWIRIVFLARTHDYDDSVEWTERYRPEIALWAMTRYYAIRDQVTNGDMDRYPDRLDQVPAAPSDDNCRWCPYRRPGGPADGTGCPGNTADQYDRAAATFTGLI